MGTLYDLERTQVMLPCVRSEHRRCPIRAYGGIACVRYTSYEPNIPLILALQRVIFGHVQYIQKHPVNFVNIHEKNSIINFKKVLPNRAFSYILIHVVTLIAMKREVATHMRGFSVERMSS